MNTQSLTGKTVVRKHSFVILGDRLSPLPAKLWHIQTPNCYTIVIILTGCITYSLTTLDTKVCQFQASWIFFTSQ